LTYGHCDLPPCTALRGETAGLEKDSGTMETAQPHRRVLALGEISPTGLGSSWAWEVAREPSTALQLLERQPPDAVVVSSDHGWALDVLRKVSSERRPAVLAVSAAPLPHTSVDEWIAPSASAEEWRARLDLALARGRTRRNAARRGYRDLLTGLPNRRAVIRALLEEAARARRGGNPPVLAVIDLDGFKAVNDTLGHLEGDRLLRRVGVALRRVTRAGEVCGRIGGDEFAVILRGGNAAAQGIAHRVRTALIQAGISATVAACVLQPGEQLRSLYRRADERLQDGKRTRHAGRDHAEQLAP
jgi:diguanylate cyclase (GGDEF)-like protein